jgi:hypothetical protein
MTEATKRVRGRISESNWIRLTAAAKAKNNSISKIIDRSLSAFFSYEIDDNRDARILQRIESLRRHQHSLKTDIELQAEAQFLFLQYFFTYTRPASSTDDDARAVLGVTGLNEFSDRLSLLVNKGGNSLKAALTDYTPRPPEFFNFEDLAKMGDITPQSAKSGDKSE